MVEKPDKHYLSQVIKLNIVNGNNQETVYNRNRKEFYSSQTKDYSVGNTDSRNT